MNNIKRDRFKYIYYGIKQRTENKHNPSYPKYGGRGIKCLWKSFDEFKHDMFASYASHVKKFGLKQTSIDRIDNNGNYCKGNCKWSTLIEQANNKRKSKIRLFLEKYY